MVFLLRLLLLELAFAGDRKDSVLDCHLYVFLFHVRQLGLDDVFLVIFGDVGERFPISDGEIISTVRTASSEEARKPVLYIGQFHWFSASECIDHSVFSFLCGGRWSAAPRPPPARDAASLRFYFAADDASVPGNLGSLFQITSRFARVRLGIELGAKGLQ